MKLKSLARASGDAVKSFFGFDSSTPIHPDSFRGGSWLFDTPYVGHDTYFTFSGNNDIITAYEKCPPVFSIVNKQALTVLNGRIYFMDNKGKEVENDWARKMKKLFAQPNPLQNWRQFEAQMVIYTRLFGYCIILPFTPIGPYGHEDATVMWIIPPFMCEFEYAKETFYNLKNGFIKRVKVRYGNEVTWLAAEKLIIIRDITPNINHVAIPGSPIKTVAQNINNLIGIYESKGTLINYRGALGILTPELDPNGAIAMNPDDEDKLHSKFMMYGLRSGQRKFIITSASMKWQQMGIPYKDLMFNEWAESDTMAICDVLTYPYKLLSNEKGSSMNGTELDSWKKQLYQDFTIPFSEMIYEQLGYYFNAEKYGCRIEKNFAHLKVLQEDDLSAAKARLERNKALLIEFQNNLITLNRWLELNEEDTLPGKEGNLYYYQLVKEGWVFGMPAKNEKLEENNQE